MSLSDDHPARCHALVMDRLAPKSNAGLPIANGILGGLIWSDGDDALLSLDRTDLWDLRPVPEFSGDAYTNDELASLVEAGDMDAIRTRFEDPYKRPEPTKLPGGRVRLSEMDWRDCHLSLYDGIAHLNARDASLSAYMQSDQEFGVLIGQGKRPTIILEAPAFGQPIPVREPDFLSPNGPEDLDYSLPDIITGQDRSGYGLTLPDGRGVCALIIWSEDASDWRAYWTIQIGADLDEACDKATRLLESANAADHDEQMARHKAWWHAFWSRAWLTLPDKKLERQWVLDAYKLGASARRGYPPVALQGPWTTDNGRLPPWKGDYHHDLNTQMTYWPCLTGNMLAPHLAFLDWLWDTRDACRDWTSHFFGVEGLNVPMTADIHNHQLGGWAPYTHSATTGAWLAHHFTAHWRRTGDRDFLEARAWPYVREAAQFLAALTSKERRNGSRALRLTSSPEINNNERSAWFNTWTNYDLTLCRNLFEEAAELALVLSEAGEGAYWKTAANELPDLALDEDGGLSIAPSHPLDASHRHFSHIMSIHPLKMLAPDDARVLASVQRLERLGTSHWMGYTFAWMAGIYARLGRGNDAANMLALFQRGFCGPNSFHTNGDISGEGLTIFPFDAFTLEGNCAAMAATQDMLLQSHLQDVHLFKALPQDWTNCAFHAFLADGGLVVSAVLEHDQVKATFLATQSGTWHLLACKDITTQILTLERGQSRTLSWQVKR